MLVLYVESWFSHSTLFPVHTNLSNFNVISNNEIVFTIMFVKIMEFSLEFKLHKQTDFSALARFDFDFLDLPLVKFFTSIPAA